MELSSPYWIFLPYIPLWIFMVIASKKNNRKLSHISILLGCFYITGFSIYHGISSENIYSRGLNFALGIFGIWLARKETIHYREYRRVMREYEDEIMEATDKINKFFWNQRN